MSRFCLNQGELQGFSGFGYGFGGKSALPELLFPLKITVVSKSTIRNILL